MPETERARVWENYNNTGKARWWERKRPSQRDCEKARIRIPILFLAPRLLLSSSLCTARLCACSDEVAAGADRRTTVLLMAESQIDVSDTWNNICSNQWDLTHSKSTVPIQAALPAKCLRKGRTVDNALELKGCTVDLPVLVNWSMHGTNNGSVIFSFRASYLSHSEVCNTLIMFRKLQTVPAITGHISFHHVSFICLKSPRLRMWPVHHFYWSLA